MNAVLHNVAGVVILVMVGVALIALFVGKIRKANRMIDEGLANVSRETGPLPMPNPRYRPDRIMVVVGTYAEMSQWRDRGGWPFTWTFSVTQDPTFALDRLGDRGIRLVWAGYPADVITVRQGLERWYEEIKSRDLMRRVDKLKEPRHLR